jgi:ribonuclease P protein component
MAERLSSVAELRVGNAWLFNNMLKKSKRATTHHIKQLALGRKTLHGGFFTLSLRYMDKKDENSRFAVIVSKKVGKTAVSRNKIRRQAYSAISNLTKSAKKGILCAFYAKKEVKTAKYLYISRDISELLKSAGII